MTQDLRRHYLRKHGAEQRMSENWCNGLSHLHSPWPLWSRFAAPSWPWREMRILFSGTNDPKGSRLWETGHSEGQKQCAFWNTRGLRGSLHAKVWYPQFPFLWGSQNSGGLVHVPQAEDWGLFFLKKIFFLLLFNVYLFISDCAGSSLLHGSFCSFGKQDYSIVAARRL